MLKSSLVVLAALITWAASSLLASLGMPNFSSLTDSLDLFGEVLFAAGILMMFVRLALNSYRSNLSAGSPIGQTRRG